MQGSPFQVDEDINAEIRLTEWDLFIITNESCVLCSTFHIP